MPPWHIDRTVGIRKLKDDPSLSDQEIAAIVAWADAGAPRGNPSEMPPPRQFQELDKWQIGAPDLVVKMPQVQTIAAEGPDWWGNFIADSGLIEDRYIPAGADNVRTEGYYKLEKNIRLVGYMPHMHNRGKRQCMEAIYPNMAVEQLNCVNYDFQWQIVYNYADDVAPLLPAGTIIHTTFWHDNSAANRNNPDPRNWVGFGNRTTDDMSRNWLTF